MVLKETSRGELNKDEGYNLKLFLDAFNRIIWPSLLVGEDGSHAGIKTNPLRVKNDNMRGAFGELLTTTLSPKFQGSFEATVDNTDLSEHKLLGSGTVTQSNGMAVVGTGTTTLSTSELRSGSHSKYEAGTGIHLKMSVKFTAPVADAFQYQGLGDERGGTAASGSVTLDSGASGSVDGITVNSVEIMSGAVSFLTSLAVTTQLVCNNINANISNPNYIATCVGAVITIIAQDKGTVPNAYVVTSSVTTISTTDANLSGGIDGARIKNGVTIGYTGLVLGMQRWSDGVLEEDIAIADWDDSLDGSGDSGDTIVPTNLNVFFFSMEYLGSGPQFLWYMSEGSDIPVLVNTISYQNKHSVPSSLNPNFHFIMLTDNGATTSDLVLSCASYGFFVEGETELIQIHQPQNSTGIISQASIQAEVVLFTLRVKKEYAGIDNFINILMERIGASVEASGANNLASIRLVKNGILSGALTYNDINTNNSVVDMSIDAGVTVTGGTNLFPDTLAGKNDKLNESLQDLKILLRHEETISLAVSSAGVATINGFGLWKELF